MERLKPILKQKFWILLGIAMIMTLVGWWTATAGMLTQIKARRDVIQKAFKDVPQGKIPRDSWAADLNVINKQQEKSITSTRALLWQEQLAKMMEWPDDVHPRAYRGPFSTTSKEAFRDPYYEEEVKKVWKQLRPFEDDGTGIVDYPITEMYSLLHRIPDQKGPVYDNEMWDIKEDLLLLESLFQTIATVNGGDQDSLRTVDMIHRINVLQLRGGGPKAKAAAAPAAATPAIQNKGGGLMDRPPGIGIPATVATSGVDLPFVDPEFNPAEEFGDDNSSAAKSAVQSPATGKTASDPKGGGRAIERYIVKDENGPFKTRGFYLSVMMDHQKIPQLIAELTANGRSKFPVEILRVQMSRLHEDLSTGSSGSSLLARPTAAATSMESPIGRDAEGDGAGLATRRRQRGRGSFDAAVAIPTTVQTKRPGEGAGDSSVQTLTAVASLEKALQHPSIAQVTICGVFTLYQKVALEEAAPKPAKPAAASPSQESNVKPEATSEGDSEKSTEKSAEDAVATSDADAAKDANGEAAAAMTDEQASEMPAESEPSPGPQATPDGNTEAVPAKKERDEK